VWAASRRLDDVFINTLEEFVNILQGASCPQRGCPDSSMTEGYVVFTTYSDCREYVSHLLKRAPTALVAKRVYYHHHHVFIKPTPVWAASRRGF
jgi:hypothetical protein